MAALVHNPGSQAERYKHYAFAYADAAGVVWQKPSKSSETGKIKHAVASAFIAEDDTKVIEASTPDTLPRLYEWMHELSHHYLDHINNEKPYHVEEFEATKMAIDTLERDGFHMTPAIRKEAAWNIEQAIGKDRRKGIRIDSEAAEYARELKQ